MTPPATGLRPAGSPSTSPLNTSKAKISTALTEKKIKKVEVVNNKDSAQTWQLIPDVRLRMNWGANGAREGQIFNDNFGQIGDFRNQGAAISLLTNANDDLVRLNLGGTFRWDYQKGRHITFGSEYHHWLLGATVEADFRPAWAQATGENWSPLAYAGANFGIGYGFGEGTHNDGLNHRHGGLAMGLSLYVNVVNFSIGKTQICLDFDYTNTHINGPKEKDNWPVSHGFGFSLAVRPSVKKMVVVNEIKIPVCAEDRTRVPTLAAEVAKLKADNEVQQARVDGLRYYLENLPKHPFNEAKVRKALMLGVLAEALQEKFGGKNANTENLGKIQIAIKAAHRADVNKLVEVVAKATGLDAAIVRNLWAGSEVKFSNAKGFWSLPVDVTIDESALAQASAPENSDDENCENVEKLRATLEEWRYQLGRRNAALEQQYRRVLHLAGLVLGDEVIEQVGTVFGATFLRVDTPNFITARPTKKHLQALKSAAEVKSPTVPGTVEAFLKISKSRGGKRVFILAKEEAEKLKNLADWMNGKAELRGEERHRKFLKDRGLEQPTGTKRQQEIENAYQEWIKSLQIMVVGHTDSRGSDRYNQSLSDKRAEYIRLSLVFFGVAPDRVKSFGAGEKYPIVPEAGQRGKGRTAARLKNRRVEFIPRTADPYSTGMDRTKLKGEHHDASKGSPPKQNQPSPKKAEPQKSKVGPPTDLKK